MNDQDFLDQFERHTAFLRRNIPPDDIYAFAEQAVIAANYFLIRWREWVEVRDEMKKDPVVKRWVTNLVALRYAQENDLNVKFNLRFDKYDEDNNSWGPYIPDEDEA